jgi:RHS repeat-associated protein
LLADRTDSIRAVVGSSGSVLAATAYGVWGSSISNVVASRTPFGFATSYTDGLGVDYLLARYYDPGTGQFMSVDPVLASTNERYEYAGDNPKASVDPSGETHYTNHYYTIWKAGYIAHAFETANSIDELVGELLQLIREIVLRI